MSGDHRYGSLCALCFGVSSMWDANISGCKKVSWFVCPTFLKVDGACYQKGAICSLCYQSMNKLFDNWHWRHSHPKIAMGMAKLIVLDSFKERLRDNRNRKLRFDPRRLELGIVRKPPKQQTSNLMAIFIESGRVAELH